METINALNLIMIVLNMLVVPYFAGYALLRMLGFETVGEPRRLYEKVLHNVRHGMRLFAGMLLSMTGFLVAALPITWFKGSFYSVLWITLGVTAFFVIFGIERLVISHKSKNSNKKTGVWNLIKTHKEETVFIIICIAAVAYYLYFVISKMHFDEDDSRYLVNAADTLRTGKLLSTDPTTGGSITKFYGDFKKDFLSPWYGYVAYISKICLIHPTVMAHTIMPVVYTLIIAILMFDIGIVVFNKDIIKTSIFVTFMFMLYIFGAYSRTSALAMKSYRLWQGKAMVASFGLPLLLLLFMILYEINDKKDIGIKWLMILFADAGLCLMSGNGIIFSAIMTGCFGLIYTILKKNWRILIWTVIAVIPNAILFILSQVLTINMYLS